VEPLGKPGVDIEAHGSVRQCGEIRLVERHGVVFEAVEIFLR
jgi:hypothetical protein